MPTALIIGASRGLGRGLVEEHLQHGWDVIATVRDATALEDLSDPRLSVETVDITDWAGVDGLRGRLDGKAIDLLFVNAGISGPDGKIGEADPDKVVELLLTNSLAPLRIVERFVDLVASDGTVAVMSSILGSIGLNSGGYEAYRVSKAALNMGFVTLAKRYKDGRSYIAFHPGWVRTDMGGPQADISVEQSVTGITDVLEKQRGKGGVAYLTYSGESLPW